MIVRGRESKWKRRDGLHKISTQKEEQKKHCSDVCYSKTRAHEVRLIEDCILRKLSVLVSYFSHHRRQFKGKKKYNVKSYNHCSLKRDKNSPRELI